ncbi:MAG: VanZ family protein [Nanoarchaeota archaeon]|jgi:VanZ family protein|nr:VanZ family protein [Nanoarchaeota archaeon]
MIIKTLEEHKTISIVITTIIAITIFIFSELPQETLNIPTSKFISLSTIYHFTIFAALAFFLIIILNKKIATLLITTAYAILDEVHQIFTPGRFPGIEDIIVDIIGIIIGIGLYYLLRKRL